MTNRTAEQRRTEQSSCAQIKTRPLLLGDKINAPAVINTCNNIFFRLINTGSAYTRRVFLSAAGIMRLGDRYIQSLQVVVRRRLLHATLRHVRFSGLISSLCRLQIQLDDLTSKE